MFDEPSEEPVERARSAAERAREQADKLRLHAELAAVFEGVRKFDAQLIPGLDAELAREIQRSMAKLERARAVKSPVLPPESAELAAGVLDFFAAHELTTNDYHLHRRPGEVMMVRWLRSEQVQTFYERIQAHFDAALEGHKEDERQAHEWKQDAAAQAYQSALEGIELKMAERYLREPIRKHKLFVLSTQAADEMNIAFLADYVMGVTPAELVGRAAAPDGEPTDQDLAWFFKLFSLRGIVGDQEAMCFFIFLQKADEEF